MTEDPTLYLNFDKKLYRIETEKIETSSDIDPDRIISGSSISTLTYLSNISYAGDVIYTPTSNIIYQSGGSLSLNGVGGNKILYTDIDGVVSGDANFWWDADDRELLLRDTLASIPPWDLYIQTKNGTTTYPDSDYIWIETGDAKSTGGKSGWVPITTGDSYNDDAGWVYLEGGECKSGNGDGGWIQMLGGDGYGTGDGGYGQLLAGNGGATGDGGEINISGGNGVIGGDINIYSGDGSTTDGKIYLGEKIEVDGGWSFGSAFAITSSAPAMAFYNYKEIHATLTDGYLGGIDFQPGYMRENTTSYTVTRHNYINITNFPTGSIPGLTPASNYDAVVDACVIRFDAAAGTHKAVDAGTTHPDISTTDAWIKVNINGTIHYIPCYTDKS